MRSQQKTMCRFLNPQLGNHQPSPIAVGLLKQEQYRER